MLLRSRSLLVMLFAAGLASAVGAAGCSSSSVGGGGNEQGGSGADAGGATTSPQTDGDGGANGDAGASSGKDSGATGPVVTTIRVHYPLSTLGGAHALALRGSASPLDWSAGKPLAKGASDTYTFTFASTSAGVTAPLEVKPLIDDATWSLGPNYKIAPGATADIYPRFTQTNGTWSRAYDFTSKTLANTRGVWIYLPPTYVENTLVKMPVVYMHDGQNLFDPNATFGGNTWKVADTMDAGANNGTIAEAIIVGPENTSARMDEYTPVADPTYMGGKGDSYLTMLVTELKPKVDAELRTLPDREHTAILGSSLGGLISAYAGVTRADTYGLVGVMSPSTWWDNNWLIGDVGTTKATPRPLRVYVDSGDSGASNDDVTQTKMLADQYRSLGYKDGATFDYVVQAGGQHNEVSWAQRLPGAMAFLLGPGR